MTFGKFFAAQCVYTKDDVAADEAGRGRGGTAAGIRRLRETGRAGHARADETAAGEGAGSGERERAPRAPAEAAAGRSTP